MHDAQSDEHGANTRISFASRDGISPSQKIHYLQWQIFNQIILMNPKFFNPMGKKYLDIIVIDNDLEAQTVRASLEWWGL